MQKVFLFLLIFFLVILQTNFLPRLPVFSVFPNILFVFVAILAVFRETRSNLFWAALSGLMLDVFSSQPFGLYALSFLFVAWLINVFGKGTFRVTDLFGRAVLLASAAATYAFIGAVLLKLFGWFDIGQPVNMRTLLWPTLASEALLNMILAVVIILAIQQFHGFFDGRKKGI